MNLVFFWLLLILFLTENTSAIAAPKNSSKQKAPDSKPVADKSKHYWDLILKAQDSLNQNRINSGIKVTSEAIALDPTKPEGYFLRGIAFRRKGQLKSSIADLDRALAIKELPLAYLERGTTLQAMSYAEPAIADFTQCIKLVPTNNRAYFRRGYAYESLGDYRKALADMNKTVELIPKRADGYFGRGHVYMGLNEPLNAIADFDKVMTLDINSSANFNKASCLVQADRPKDAIVEYSKVIELSPRHPSAYMNRGRTYVLLGKPDEAIYDLTQAIAVAPDNEMLYLFRGRAYQLKGDMKHADEDLRQATMKETDFAESHFESGVNGLLTENAESQSPTANHAIQRRNAKRAPDAQIQKALDLKAKKKYSDSLSILNKCIAEQPSQLEAYIAKGQLLTEMGQYDQAIVSFTAAWHRHNMNVEAIHGRAMAYAAKGDFAHALPDLNKLIWFDPFCPNYYFEKGEALRNKGRRVAALQCYKKFLSMIDEKKNVSIGHITKYSIKPENVKIAKDQLARIETKTLQKGYLYLK